MELKEYLEIIRKETSVIEQKKAKEKLNLIKNAYEKLPFEINKLDILNEVKRRLLEHKGILIETRKQKLSIDNSVEYLNDIEIYTLLLEYMEKDKTINKNIKTKIKSI